MLYQNFPMMILAGCLGSIIGLPLTVDWAKRSQLKPLVAYSQWLSVLLLFSIISLFYSLVALFLSNAFPIRIIEVFVYIVPAIACFLFGLAVLLIVRRKVMNTIIFHIAELIYAIYLLVLLWLWGDIFGKWAITKLSPVALSSNDVEQKSFLALALITWLASACLIYSLTRIAFSGRIRDLLKTARQAKNL
mgnify:CR=1 FL=1